MTTKELVRTIANNTGITMKDITTVLENYQEVIKETVASGEKISMIGFMNISKVTIPAKSGVSTLRGETKEWSSPVHDEIKVTLSKSYKAL